LDQTIFVQRAIFIGFLAAILAGLRVIKIGANRRIRQLATSVVLLALCQGSAVAVTALDWQTKDLGRSIEILQLMACALALAFTHQLNRESRDRTTTDMRLRILDPIDVAHAWSEERQNPIRAERSKLVAVGRPERRKTPRFPIGEHGTIQLLDIAEQPKIRVTGLDLSERGLAVECPISLRISSCVRVDFRGHLMIGEVVHCRPSANGSVIGIVLQDWLSRECLEALLFFSGNGVEHNSLSPAKSETPSPKVHVNKANCSDHQSSNPERWYPA